ncbi:MAG: sigma-70 family RNA polymerase sigma factor [Acidimicrobiales bacterium]
MAFPSEPDEAFAEFFESARSRCLRAVVLTVRDRHLGEDLLEEAFVRAYERWDRLHTHPNPSAWVVTTAVNLSRRRWRRGQREVELTPPAHDVPAPDEPMDAVLLDAVLALPDRQREVVAHRLVLESSTNQTAEALGISPKTVTVHLHRALRTLNSDEGLRNLWSDDGADLGDDLGGG